MNFLDLAPLAVVLPIIGAGAAFLARRQVRTQRLITIGVLCLTLVLEAGMLATAAGNSDVTSVAVADDGHPQAGKQGDFCVHAAPSTATAPCSAKARAASSAVR